MGSADAAGLFGAVASDYALHRPTYPEAFVEAFCQRLQPAAGTAAVVWDCGCGNGQASLALANLGVAVIATDASAEQLAMATAHPLIRYQQASAQSSGLADASVDGVLVATAVHWFAGEAFNAEVRRVCRPGAAMAWIGYLPLQLPEAPLQQCLDHFYARTLEPWWPPERQWVDRSYAGLPFPGVEWPFPQNLWIERHWDLPQLLGYLGTWSAVQTARQEGQELLTSLAGKLKVLWPGSGGTPMLMRWPFMGRWGEVR
jgi:SAM-dependent methyltransferase